MKPENLLLRWNLLFNENITTVRDHYFSALGDKFCIFLFKNRVRKSHIVVFDDTS